MGPRGGRWRRTRVNKNGGGLPERMMGGGCSRQQKPDSSASTSLARTDPHFSPNSDAQHNLKAHTHKTMTQYIDRPGNLSKHMAWHCTAVKQTRFGKQEEAITPTMIPRTTALKNPPLILYSDYVLQTVPFMCNSCVSHLCLPHVHQSHSSCRHEPSNASSQPRQPDPHNRELTLPSQPNTTQVLAPR